MRKLTTEEFIRKAREKHGNKFGYENLIYVNNRTLVEIICLTCNEIFLQNPNNHLRGSGCSRCASRIRGEKSVKTKEQFIKDATEVHGNKYGYEKVVYAYARDPIEIICLTCNESFSQTPDNHLHGKGCPKCGIQMNTERRTKTKEQFIKDATEVHGNKYGYEKVVYITTHIPIKIICLKCRREFSQSPNSHLRGSGCPNCLNKTEEIVASKLHEILDPLGFEVEQTGRRVFDGIGRMDITITKEDLVIFVEVDGLQHFEYVKQYRSEALDVQKRDLKKHICAVERGHKVIRIDQEWVWNSQAKNNMEWASWLYDTIVKLDSGTEPSIDEMFLSDKSDKYHDHLCYRHCKT